MIRRRVVLGGVLGALFALGWWAGGTRAASGLYSGLDLFIEVLQTVQANYVDVVDSGKLVTGAMRGVTRALDPWSRYLDPDEFRATRNVIQGSFDGIGATVDQRGGWPVVVAPIEGSPAWKAGLEPGDVITKVDGHSTFGLSPDEVGAKLRGAASTIVTLTVARDDDERELKLQREKVQVRNVPYAFLAAPGVGYVRLAHFSAHASADVAAACDTLRTQGARALLLDLRGNPGGTFDEAVAIASQFLPNGTTIVSTKGRANGSGQLYKSTRTRSELTWPVAVLVDGGSASASEIVAGALQDHDRAVLVGDTTFGKGVSQQIYPLRGSAGALQLTVSHYYTPSGRSIHRQSTLTIDEDEEGEGDVPLAPRALTSDSVRARSYRTDAGRVVRGGGGLAPDVRVAADSAATRMRVLSHHPGGLVGAAHESLARDPVYLRALEVVKKASDARGVFAAAGLKLPKFGGRAPLKAPSRMPVAWLCDFDGTVSPRDIGAAFVERFSPGGAAARVPELAGWFAGRCGHRALTRAQCALVRAGRDEALAFASGFALDPAFAPFAHEALARGDVVMVVSEGFDFYVRERLEHEGLAALPWAANRLRFTDDGAVVPEFPFADPACDDCGNCKAQHVRRYRALGFRTVLVGDGTSDRHGALAADHVLARGSLLDWCRSGAGERVPHTAVVDFRDVADWADGQRSATAMPRGASL